MRELKVPKYYQVKNDMEEKIESGLWQCNELIPSERELSEMYEASRITVRRAISELVSEGYLYSVQGKGTFVKSDGYVQDLFSISSCSEDIKKLGMTATRKMISSEVTKADAELCSRLLLNNGDNIFTMERVIYANNDPINITRTNIPYKYVPGIEKYDFSENSLYEILKNKYNIIITKTVRTIEAVIADEKIAKHLQINKGVPILLFIATTYGKVNGMERPVESFVCHYSSQKFKFYINQVK